MALKGVERTHRIGVIGGGNMGEAFIGGLIRSDTVEAHRILVSDADSRRLKFFRRRYSIETVVDNRQLFRESTVVILAVKPQQMQAMLTEIAESRDKAPRKKKLLISIAAGFPIRKIEAILYASLNEAEKKRLPIIRVMPNTPAQVLQGVSGMSPNRYATRPDIRRAHTILSSVGCVLEFREKDLDAVTALSGSGPAYVFYFIESLIKAGIHMGLSQESATTLIQNTFQGAIALLQEQGDSPEALRKKVTSPGGTTEAAIRVMEKKHLPKILLEAVTAATHRGKELSR